MSASARAKELFDQLRQADKRVRGEGIAPLVNELQEIFEGTAAPPETTQPEPKAEAESDDNDDESEDGGFGD